ncbi:Meiotic_cell_cortex_C-terminal_pleckstrin_homology_-_putative [Leishmania major strain Friedlin]|nr:Meiotic_cell_cortex_C-terminal_pleckstrin_homology_-_putative [Leishmania major strain Friedlin]
MSDPVRRRYVDSGYPSYARPHAFDAYDSFPREADVVEQQQQQQPSHQPLRRRGAPVPAPQLLLSARSTPLAKRPAPVKTPYKSASTTTTSSLIESAPCTNSSGSSDTATASPPHDDQPTHLNKTQRPLLASASSARTSASVMSPLQQQVARERRQNEYRHSSSLLQGGQSPAMQMTPLPAPARSSERSASAVPPPVSRRAHQRSSLSTTPGEQRRADGHSQRLPTSRAPGSSMLTATEQMTIGHSHPAAVSLHSASPIRGLEGHKGRVDQARSPAPRTSSSTPRSSTVANNVHPGPFYKRQQAQAPSPTGHSPTTRGSSTVVEEPARATADRRVVAEPASNKADAQLVAPKELRRQRGQGEIRGQGYVAQTAYTQRNPFRRQDFAEFAGNPQYLPPHGFHVYPQAMATRVYGLEVSRASQGDCMMQSLLDAAHPSTAEERAEMEALLSATLEKLQLGDWFYKWTRIKRVHQRYVWLNLQRGTLMWSVSPKKSAVLSSEVKLSTVTSVTPECLQLEAPVRFFYRMNINTPHRCISLATEIREKFDVWYHVLQQLAAPNSMYGVPGVWGRPSSSVNAAGWGAASRWASRYSPLSAVVDNATGPTGYNEAYAHGAVSSSD